MKTMLQTSITILLMAMAIAGCGTIMQGTSQQVSISSNPSNARVSINGRSEGNTPLVIDLKRKDTHMIKIELDGYEPYETALTRKVSGWVWGNIVFGGLIGLVVDAAAGGMYKLTPEQVMAELRSRSMTATQTSEGLYVAVVLQPKPEWEKVGQLKTAGIE